MRENMSKKFQKALSALAEPKFNLIYKCGCIVGEGDINLAQKVTFEYCHKCKKIIRLADKLIREDKNQKKRENN